MSDETTRRDSWSSNEAPGETPQSTQAAAQPATPSAEAASDRVGFCQDCGKPLTSSTVRTAGTGVFCEPCLTTRVGATAPASPYAAVPPYAPVPPQIPFPNEPSPALAAILGFIPGVGAMYNGQFAKGIVHLIIFAILVSLSDNVNGIFGLFVIGWIFYMAFEAYHTAVARRDGLLLPNAFGFNDIGERMGFGKGWGTHTAHTSGVGAPPPSNAARSSAPAAAPISEAPPSPYTPPMNTAPDWVGYVPPAAFATATSEQRAAAPPPAAQAYAQAPNGPGYGHVPYTETYTGTAAASSAAYGAAPVTAGMVPDLPARRFPAAALWLIGLGVLILLANVLPDWRLTSRWWQPVLFAGLAVWTFTRRRRTSARLVCIIRWPVILMVLALMSALHAAYFPITFWFTCSVLLIVFGALLVLERTAGAGPVYAPTAPAYPTGAYAENLPSEEDNARAAWNTSAAGDPSRVGPETPKDGQ